MYAQTSLPSRTPTPPHPTNTHSALIWKIFGKILSSSKKRQCNRGCISIDGDWADHSSFTLPQIHSPPHSILTPQLHHPGSMDSGFWLDWANMRQFKGRGKRALEHCPSPLLPLLQHCCSVPGCIPSGQLLLHSGLPLILSVHPGFKCMPLPPPVSSQGSNDFPGCAILGSLNIAYRFLFSLSRIPSERAFCFLRASDHYSESPFSLAQTARRKSNIFLAELELHTVVLLF